MRTGIDLNQLMRDQVRQEKNGWTKPFSGSGTRWKPAVNM